MKKILFYTHNIFTKENPVGYRIQQYFPYLEERGFKVSLLTTKADLGTLLRTASRSDVVVVQRVLLSPMKLSLLKMFAKKMVYDFDDAVMYGRKGESATRRNRFAAIVRASKAVLCGNSFLMEEAGRYRDSGIHYMPTTVDINEYPVKVHEERRTFVVGWIGTSSTLRYLDGIRDLILSITDREGIEFRVIADRPFGVEKRGITFQRWNKEREKEMLLDFDMGIMPAADDTWSRGKCGLKLIQYMAMGLPSVTNPVGVSKEIVADGVNGFLRTDPVGWDEAIRALTSDVALRRRIGAAARQTAVERYSLQTWGKRFARIVDSL
ncbi:MAG: Glycosyl transferases group 1 [Syntrophorhabdus sp. PtaB.Bin047]|jgi:glycosyltransferase involved in cell wall biosynthesis|nr:MAG: Glycosyl transferases group 1 [Syntrophorhabdus sp. PtaB.Bin047]